MRGPHHHQHRPTMPTTTASRAHPAGAQSADLPLRYAENGASRGPARSPARSRLSRQRALRSQHQSRSIPREPDHAIAAVVTAPPVPASQFLHATPRAVIVTATFIVAVASKLVSAVVMSEGIGVPRDHHSGDHLDVRDACKARAAIQEAGRGQSHGSTDRRRARRVAAPAADEALSRTARPFCSQEARTTQVARSRGTCVTG